jgi:hypothetical protein
LAPVAAAVRSLVVARDNDVEVADASADIDYWEHLGTDEVVVDRGNCSCVVDASRTSVLVGEVIEPVCRMSLKFQK